LKIRPKNWRDFQHYKDRSPPWIRLHRRLLDDKDFQRLPVASRALAPMLWLLASESVEGWIDADPDELAFRLRTTEKDITLALRPLLEKGFFSPEQDASAVLAECSQVAVPETETETETKQREKSPAALTLDDLESEGVSREAASEWIAVRKRKKGGPVTPLAWSGFKSQVDKAGWSLEAAVRKCIERSWISFEAAWVAEGKPGANSAPGGHTVPSRAADETARYLAERREQEQHATPPPPHIKALVGRAIKTEAA
jgi:hypothetical protein